MYASSKRGELPCSAWIRFSINKAYYYSEKKNLCKIHRPVLVLLLPIHDISKLCSVFNFPHEYTLLSENSISSVSKVYRHPVCIIALLWLDSSMTSEYPAPFQAPMDHGSGQVATSFCENTAVPLRQNTTPKSNGGLVHLLEETSRGKGVLTQGLRPHLNNSKWQIVERNNITEPFTVTSVECSMEFTEGNVYCSKCKAAFKCRNTLRRHQQKVACHIPYKLRRKMKKMELQGHKTA